MKVTQNSALAENSYKRLAPFLFKKENDHKRKSFLIKSKCTENTIRLYISHKIDSHKKKSRKKCINLKNI